MGRLPRNAGLSGEMQESFSGDERFRATLAELRREEDVKPCADARRTKDDKATREVAAGQRRKGGKKRTGNKMVENKIFEESEYTPAELRRQHKLAFQHAAACL